MKRNEISQEENSRYRPRVQVQYQCSFMFLFIHIACILNWPKTRDPVPPVPHGRTPQPGRTTGQYIIIDHPSHAPPNSRSRHKSNMYLYLDHGALLYTLNFMLITTATAVALASAIPVICRRRRPNLFLIRHHPCSCCSLYPPFRRSCVLRTCYPLAPQAVSVCTPPPPSRPMFPSSAASVGCPRSSSVPAAALGQ